jgi:hypothetical protein
MRTTTTLTSSLIHSATTNPKTIHRKQLTELQLEALHILYKFRFSTSELISQYQERTIRNSNIRLKNLLEQEYIGRNYDDSYRIKHRPATYFLLPKAIRLLKANPKLDHKGLHLSYYSRKAEPSFIAHCLRLLRLYLRFDEMYGSNLEFFTSAELAEQTNFPSVRPDAYLSFSGKHKTIPNCMLELIESNKPLSQIRQRVNRYLYHYETSSEWGNDYPCILLVCDNVGLEREVQQHLARKINYRGIITPEYYTTTLRAVYSATNVRTPVWSNVLQPEKQVILADLSVNP